MAGGNSAEGKWVWEKRLIRQSEIHLKRQSLDENLDGGPFFYDFGCTVVMP